MVEHTSTPWFASVPIYSNGYAHVSTRASFDGDIATCWHKGPDVSTVVSAANAAFIVRAVNVHDELVAALKAVIDATQAYLPPDGIPQDELINRVLAATDNPRINAALAKAGG